MNNWVAWYVAATLLGWLAFPVAYRLLPGLKDRGYTASRTLGLLIWGFTFWLLASFGALPFNMGGLLFAAAILVGLSAWALSGGRWGEIWSWVRAQKRVVLTGEALFLVAFAGWAVVRAANPEAVGTEKPMELAFINAILRSPTFPPHDPWLSGYAISYYYFGYVMTAMLARITGTAGSVAFNLGIALVFALSACGAYGLVFNLLNAARGQPAVKERPKFTFAALLGPLYVLIISNLEGFLEVLHSAGLFWRRGADGTLTSAFWNWLGILDLSSPPGEPFSLVPSRFWWWWRASRVVQDFDLRGVPKEIIDEFPFFSYLLADLHPHVLAMPFAFLAMTLALNLLLGAQSEMKQGLRFRLQQAYLGWIAILAVPGGLVGLFFGALGRRASLTGVGFGLLILSAVLLWQSIRSGEENTLDAILTSKRQVVFGLEIEPGFFLLAAIALGGMAFLNTWDFPVYVFIFAAAYGLGKVIYQGQGWRHALGQFIWMGVALGVSGFVLYLPFYLGFSSQAGGILPNLVYPTRGVQFWVMFVPLLFPIFGYLFYQQSQNRSRRALLRGLAQAGGVMLGLWLVSLLFGWGIVFLPEKGQLFLSSIGAQTSGEALGAALARRVQSPGTWITLLLALGLILSLVPRIDTLAKDDGQETPGRKGDGRPLNPPTIFTLLLILTGLLLTLAPEFFYLLDLFGWRMNTIFKFYFQAWLIWSIAAAVGGVALIRQLKKPWNVLFQASMALVWMACLTYPVLSLLTKTNNFQPGTWTLDSTAYFAAQSPGEMAAINWLKTAPFGVVAEAVPVSGGSYTEYARVATFSGLPGVMGWVGHEDQWRGGSQAFSSRRPDLERLYCTRDWDEARLILDQYQVRYVFVGNLERTAYQPDSSTCPMGLVEEKFAHNLDAAFKDGEVVIYEYAGEIENGSIPN